MRAKVEYEKWCALERAWEESRFGVMQEKAYVTGKPSNSVNGNILKGEGI